MTVVSQVGEHTDAFAVRYEPSAHAWQLIMPEKDEAGAAETVVSQMEVPDGGEGPGHRLAVVYDDATDTVKLYLDGVTNARATGTVPNGWRSSGALEIGRAQAGDGWGEYLHGDVDEVQAYAGALKDRAVSMLGWGTGPCVECWIASEKGLALRRDDWGSGRGVFPRISGPCWSRCRCRCRWWCEAGLQPAAHASASKT